MMYIVPIISSNRNGICQSRRRFLFGVFICLFRVLLSWVLLAYSFYEAYIILVCTLSGNVKEWRVAVCVHRNCYKVMMMLNVAPSRDVPVFPNPGTYHTFPASPSLCARRRLYRADHPKWNGPQIFASTANTNSAQWQWAEALLICMAAWSCQTGSFSTELPTSYLNEVKAYLAPTYTR